MSFLDGGELRNIEPILADPTYVEHEFLRPLCCRKIGTDG
jgi:hypothetical protein